MELSLILFCAYIVFVGIFVVRMYLGNPELSPFEFTVFRPYLLKGESSVFGYLSFIVATILWMAEDVHNTVTLPLVALFFAGLLRELSQLLPRYQQLKWNLESLERHPGTMEVLESGSLGDLGGIACHPHFSSDFMTILCKHFPTIDTAFNNKKIILRHQLENGKAPFDSLKELTMWSWAFPSDFKSYVFSYMNGGKGIVKHD